MTHFRGRSESLSCTCHNHTPSSWDIQCAQEPYYAAVCPKHHYYLQITLQDVFKISKYLEEPESYLFNEICFPETSVVPVKVFIADLKKMNSLRLTKRQVGSHKLKDTSIWSPCTLGENGHFIKHVLRLPGRSSFLPKSLHIHESYFSIRGLYKESPKVLLKCKSFIW